MADSLDKFMEKMSKFMEDQKEGSTRGAGRPVKQYPLSLTSVVAPAAGVPSLTGGATRPTSIEEQIIQSRLNKRAMDTLRREEEADEERLRRETMENKAATLDAEVKLERLKREQQTGLDGAKGPLDPVHQTVQVMSAMKNLENQIGGGASGQAEMAKTLFEAQKAFQQQLFQMQSENQKAVAALQEKAASAEKTVLQVQLDNMNRALSDMKNAQQPRDAVTQLKEILKIQSEIGKLGGGQPDPESKKVDLLMEEIKNNTNLQIKKLEVDHLRWVEEQKSTTAKWEAALAAGMPLLQTLALPILQKRMASEGAASAGAQPPPPLPAGTLPVTDRPALPPPSLGPATATPGGAPQPPPPPPAPPVSGTPEPPPPAPVFQNPDGSLKITCPTCRNKFDGKPNQPSYLCPICSTLIDIQQKR